MPVRDVRRTLWSVSSVTMTDFTDEMITSRPDLFMAGIFKFGLN